MGRDIMPPSAGEEIGLVWEQMLKRAFLQILRDDYIAVKSFS